MKHRLASLVGTVQHTVRRHRMIAAGDRVLLAASGGPDSTGLVIVMAALAERFGCELVVAHVHHGLRGAAADLDQAAVRDLAQGLGLPFVSAAANVPDGGNLEARARDLRYAALHDMATANGCSAIATGHTRDDQAETFLLRLLRGAGATGLAGIKPRRSDGVIRPLLECDREAIAEVVSEAGVVSRDDEMNRDPRFLRTRVRHELLPLMRQLNPEVADSVARSADALRAAAAVEEAWQADRASARMAATRDERDRSLPLEELATVDPEMRRSLLLGWLRSAAPGISPVARHVEAVDRLADLSSPGTAVDLPGGWCVRRQGGSLVLVPPGERGADPFEPLPLPLGRVVALPNQWKLRTRVVDRRDGVEVDLPRDLWSAVCDLDRCGELTVRVPRVGERLTPLGVNGTKKLSEVFIDKHIPKADRAGYPVIASPAGALWVPGVVRSAISPIDGQTARIAVLSVQTVTVAGPGGP